MDLEGITLSEIRQVERQMPQDLTHVESKKTTEPRLIDMENNLMIARGDGG